MERRSTLAVNREPGAAEGGAPEGLLPKGLPGKAQRSGFDGKEDEQRSD